MFLQAVNPCYLHKIIRESPMAISCPGWKTRSRLGKPKTAAGKRRVELPRMATCLVFLSDLLAKNKGSHGSNAKMKVTFTNKRPSKKNKSLWRYL